MEEHEGTLSTSVFIRATTLQVTTTPMLLIWLPIWRSWTFKIPPRASRNYWTSSKRALLLRFNQNIVFLWLISLYYWDKLWINNNRYILLVNGIEILFVLPFFPDNWSNHAVASSQDNVSARLVEDIISRLDKDGDDDELLHEEKRIGRLGFGGKEGARG